MACGIAVYDTEGTPPFSLRHPQLSVISQADVELEALRESAPEPEYEAAKKVGLSEIIELADVKQRDVMHLPFKDTVLIEGPPGSGKTSIGLMRIPCLIDRQWDELGLDPSKDLPFHRIASMRVLVLNDEMIDYLGKLIQSVGVDGVEVQTFAAFCRQICGDARTLSGVLVGETPQLARLKLHPLSMPTYWAGFRKSVGSLWDRRCESLAHALAAVGQQAGELLFKTIDEWVAAIRAAPSPSAALPRNINLPHVLRKWREECRQLREAITRYGEKKQAADQFTRLQRFSIRLARRLLNRHAIVRSAVNCEQFENLRDEALDANRAQATIGEWLSQARDRKFTEADTVLAAWLATYVSHLSTESERQGIGFVRPPLTHVVIDEAQDISPCHVTVLRRLLDKNGTITMVGDLRQRITQHGHFERWEDLGAGKVKNVVFAVNHRQSKPLGDFVRGLHSCLYDGAPKWKSTKRSGLLPRLRRQCGNVRLAEAVAEEVLYWRESIRNATVGVLFHGKRWDGLRKLAKRVETALSDTLTRVYLAVGPGRAHFLTKSDCAIIATVQGTKGLEFDATVVIDPHQVWKGPLDEISTVQRNAMYVSASRGRQGLSLIVDDRSILMNGGIDATLFERVE